MTSKTRPEKAAQRKAYARLWWISFHVFDYAVLAHAGALGLPTQSPGELAVTVAIAGVNLAAYAALQRSSPGFLAPRRVEDLEAAASGATGDESTITAASSSDTDADLLVPNADARRKDDTDGLEHFCDACQIFQPLRTKHCKDCDRCVRQYDHHCDCAGTCIGQENRRRFVVYLGTQVLEGVTMIGLAASAFSLQSTVDEWFRVNFAYIIAWLSMFFMLLVAIPLLCYQLFLISTNQTSWEHARRSAITYLRDLRTEDSPFDRGCLQNWLTFWRGGDSNRWVHASTVDETSIM